MEDANQRLHQEIVEEDMRQQIEDQAQRE
jgi:hypothetical protein